MNHPLPSRSPTFPSLLACLLIHSFLQAAPSRVEVEHHANATDLSFRSLPSPAANDAAQGHTFELIDGQLDPNGGGLPCLTDGRVPESDDHPQANLFFRAGSDGGRLHLDLGRNISLAAIHTFSWHANTRGPQVYTVYAAVANPTILNPSPKRGTDPTTCGWTKLASVNTVPPPIREPGGAHGVRITAESDNSLGQFRHLLFDILPTEKNDPFGNTFFSEIDVIEAGGPELKPADTGRGELIQIRFETASGKYRFLIDATDAPDLENWAREQLQPVIQEWYPKLVNLLPSEGYVAPTEVHLRFRSDMGGTPASAGSNRINLNTQWFRRELNREARGSVVHELVHVVQSYGRARRTNPNATRNPGWLVEGIADYIRWFLYEPETRGAEITRRNLDRARYDASYRITGNFLNWVTHTHDASIVTKLNAAARDGRYSEDLWVNYTGHSLTELDTAWRQALELHLQDKPE
jgi:hypothetical protein